MILYPCQSCPVWGIGGPFPDLEQDIGTDADADGQHPFFAEEIYQVHEKPGFSAAAIFRKFRVLAGH